jgi:hypothetical protein
MEIEVQAQLAYTACMKRIQYTIRGIPESLDERLRRNSVREGASLNEAVLAALRRGAGMEGGPHRYDDMDDLAGRWVKDPEFDRAIAAMDRIDEDLWK